MRCTNFGTMAITATLISLASCSPSGPTPVEATTPDHPVNPGSAPVAHVTFAAARRALTVGDSTATTVTLTDAQGHVLTGRSIAFLSDNPATASISAKGIVTGVRAGTVRIHAVSEGVTGRDTIVVAAAAPTLDSVVLTPATATLAPGATLQFTVTGIWSDGSAAVPEVTFTATGGAITADGLFTAGATSGTYRVIATQRAGAKSDSAVVDVVTPAPAVPTLRSLATARRFLIGAAVRDTAFSADAEYLQTLTTQYNSIVPEDATDFWPIHPGPAQYNFAAADALVNFAHANGMAFHGHHLVWHAWIPTWVTSGGYTSAQIRDILKDHITTVVGRYRGKADSWDVVNEVIDNQGCFTNQCGLRSSFWLTHLGPEYIDSAFVWAHRADPAAKLYLNEYRTETIMNKSDAVLALVKGLKSRGVPIDGVGFQVHILQQFFPIPTSAQVQANFQRFADAGFDIRITEMDVAIPDAGGAEALAGQAAIYGVFLDACLKVARCNELTTWGFSDRYNWIPKSFPGYGRALPFDINYQPKPSYYSLLNRLSQP